MKRFLSALLSALLLVTLCVPAAAAAEETADQRLAKVTAKVKATLGIGDEYTTFSGELWENELTPTWSLNWSREEDRISVTATEDGKVLSYNLYLEEDAASPASDSQFPPVFPAVGTEEAQKAAEGFLKRVLDPSLETASFHEGGSTRLSGGVYRLGGDILFNGLPSPLSFSISVRFSDGRVTRFRRDSMEDSFIGGVPSAKAASGRTAAGELLKSTLKLRLEYVLDGEKSASLRYLPESTDDYYVDAQTGKLVNLTELYREASKADSGGSFQNTNAAMGDAAAPEASPEEERGLSQAELEGVAKLEGVQAKEALDQLLREISGLGLEKYALTSAGYSLNEETGVVSASLSYTRREGDSLWRRTVTCDARTGELMGVYSSVPYDKERKAAVSEEEARKIAEDFLSGLWGDEYAASALRESDPWQEGGWGGAHSFAYSQQENGVFLPANSLSVSVDVTDGSISGLSRLWTEGVTFESIEGIVDMDAALDAWFGHYEVQLGYLSSPVKLDLSRLPGAAELLELGYEYFYELKLGYGLQAGADRYYRGVDARTGEVLSEPSGETRIVYDDLADHWVAPYAGKLAEYGVGWMGGSLRPEKALTQRDLLALLVSASGYYYDPAVDEADGLYRCAYNLGILTPGQREDGRFMTRGESVRLMLDAAGYGGVAKLPGIFTCAYEDREELPEELLGYAALAQGLGIIHGSFGAGNTVTRAEAAMMLYNMMNRSAR